jgi:hypothetical protein
MLAFLPTGGRDEAQGGTSPILLVFLPTGAAGLGLDFASSHMERCSGECALGIVRPDIEGTLSHLALNGGPRFRR